MTPRASPILPDLDWVPASGKLALRELTEEAPEPSQFDDQLLGEALGEVALILVVVRNAEMLGTAIEIGRVPSLGSCVAQPMPAADVAPISPRTDRDERAR